MNLETEIILDVIGVERDQSIPQTTATPRFIRAHCRTTQGPFDLRIEFGAAAKLAAHLDKSLTEGSVQFLGPGPFDLPVAQDAKAEAGTDAVTISFRILMNPSRAEQVRIAIPNNRALELAAAIAQAASAKRKTP